MEGIQDIKLDYKQINHFRSSFGGQKRLTIVTPSIILPETIDSIISIRFSLDFLHLECLFPHGYHDLSIFKTIPTLAIVDNRSSREKFCVFSPSFTCNQLKLSCFDLSSWNNLNTMTNNFSVLRLFEISGITHLPLMPTVRELAIQDCHDLLTIPTLERLVKLTLASVHQLLSIASLQPCLRVVTISRALKLSELSFHGLNNDNVVKSLDLYQSPQITDIAVFARIPYLQISECDGIRSSAGLNGNSLENDRKNIKFTRLNNLIDFSCLYNIYQLELVSIPHLTNGEGIHNIHHLKFTHCFHLKDLSGISKIKSSITLYGCSKLVNLINIEGIPNVVLVGDVTKMCFDGLKNHEVVRIVCQSPRKNPRRDRPLYLQPLQREMNIQRLII
eukprot:gene5710-6137_t